MKVKQIIHGYCDANVYGVVIDFTPQGVLSDEPKYQYSAYVDFNRRTGQINLPTTIKNEVRGEEGGIHPESRPVKELEATARKFAGTALPADGSTLTLVGKA